MSLETIIMADVIQSRKLGQAELGRQLVAFTARLNAMRRDSIRSPLTVTLGDEFQGVARDLQAGGQLLFAAEELRLRENCAFQLRYVIYEGVIETAINTENSHGMLGAGLTAARTILARKDRARPHIYFHLQDARLTYLLNRLGRLLWTLLKDWKRNDYQLIADMITPDDDAAVARRWGKDRSQIWKRRRSLRIPDYIDLKEVIQDLMMPLPEINESGV